ncbi:thiamine phosphate synthase [Methylovirgula sp. HY1]|uniref:thiamine phosphate synthase n=1 Tax=Methylovirgula sp. HY1 TaxID=2822761 RepID=UPI001C5AF1A1|nr:thiamine phosphate synthase [Methylovirgula sp. HY1]QXX74884.1 Thiamine-phosphate synthase [Methylovirgula sp. HY1]
MAEATTRLYLITPPLAEAAGFVPVFEAALAAGDIACVFIRTQALAASEIKKIVATLAPLAHKHETAVLVADPVLAARVDADGVHVLGTGPELEAALAAMKPDRIVGVGQVATRHEAMLAGESGADYVMFGSPDAAPEASSEPAVDDDDQDDDVSVGGRIAWWAEIFTLPCVGYATSVADVGPFAQAGADFVALGDAVWQHPEGAAAAVEAAMRALAAAREPIP